MWLEPRPLLFSTQPNSVESDRLALLGEILTLFMRAGDHPVLIRILSVAGEDSDPESVVCIVGGSQHHQSITGSLSVCLRVFGIYGQVRLFHSPDAARFVFGTGC